MLDPPFRPVLDQEAPAQIRDLCTRCWLADPQGRPTFQQIAVELRLMNVSDMNKKLADATAARFSARDSRARALELERGLSPCRGEPFLTDCA